MSRGGALAVALVFSVVGCTEAATIDPSGAAHDAGGSGGAGAAGPQMMFVPYKPAPGGGTGNGGGWLPASAGKAGASGGGTAGMPGDGAAAATGAGGRATAGTGGAAGAIAATMLNLLPVAISRDGSVVAGSDEMTGQHAMMWTAKQGARLLPPLKATHDRSEVTFVSPFGDVFGFTSNSTTGERQGVSWSAETGEPSNAVSTGYPGDCTFIPTALSTVGNLAATCTHASGSREAFNVMFGLPIGLGFLPGDSDSEAVVMSADGSTIVGTSYNETTRVQHAFRWTIQTGMTELPSLGGGAFVLPRAVNGDGSMIATDAWVGVPTFPGVAHPVVKSALVWMKGVTNRLGPCPGSTIDSRVVAISAKTSAILGACLVEADATPPDEFPFLAEMPPSVKLLMPPPPFSRVTPVGISAAGELIVGLGHLESGPPAVVLWRFGATAPTTMMMTSSMPTATAPAAEPVDVSIAAVSEDGTTLVGARVDEDGSRHGWLIHP